MAIKVNDTKRLVVPMGTSLNTLADDFDEFARDWPSFKLTQTYRSQDGSELVLTFEESK